jgi:hypothetical protein
MKSTYQKRFIIESVPHFHHEGQALLFFHPSCFGQWDFVLGFVRDSNIQILA